MARKAEIIPATAEHIQHIADNMRPGDRAELAAIRRTPAASLSASLRLSRIAWTGTVDGEPICMFGVASTSMLTPHKGRPWMLGTTMLDDNAIIFLRRNKPMIKKMLDLFPELENYVAESNVKAVEWLRWLGFSFGEAEPMGVGGEMFVKFFKRRAVDV